MTERKEEKMKLKSCNNTQRLAMFSEALLTFCISNLISCFHLQQRHDLYHEKNGLAEAQWS